jgi:class 3 adenylate cyclase
VGLLGYVQHDRIRGEWRQRFLRPGDATLDASGILPRATRYLLHPVLSDVIGRANPAFLERVDKLNIVGYDKPWREAAASEPEKAHTQHYCVLKADVQGFGSLMRAGADAPVRRAMEAAVQRWSPTSSIAETGAGDAALIADADPVAIAQTARHLMDDVYTAPGQPRLRIALHYGPVHTRPRNHGKSAVIVGGDAVLCAARVEPIVEPGQIWATEEFREQLQLRPSLWRTTAIPAPGGDERVNVRKDGGDEPDLWVRLYRLEF